jgi:hypothetical protein
VGGRAARTSLPRVLESFKLAACKVGPVHMAHGAIVEGQAFKSISKLEFRRDGILPSLQGSIRENVIEIRQAM